MIAVTVMYLRLIRNLVPNVADEPSVRSLKLAASTALQRRLGWCATTVCMPTVAAAISPEFGHVQFLPASLREEVLAAVGNWSKAYPLRGAHADDLMAVDDIVRLDDDDINYTKIVKAMHAHFVKHRPGTPAEQVDALFMPDAESRGKYDVLEFWRKQASGSLAPIINIAAIVLPVQATGGGSERVFSSYNFIVDPSRRRLSDVNIAMLTVVRQVMRLNVVHLSFFLLVSRLIATKRSDRHVSRGARGTLEATR